MANVNEQIVTGKKYRILTDAAQKVWDRISFWTKASDVEIDKANNQTETLQQFANRVGVPMTGATSSTNGAEGLAPAPSAGDEKKLLSGAGTYVPDAYIFDTLSEAQAALSGGTLPGDGATVMVKEDGPNPDTGDTTVDPNSTNWVQNQAIANAIATNKTSILSNMAPIETASTAASAYAIGDHLVYNGILYKAKTAIAINDAFVVGTNIEAATVGSELTTLNTGVAQLNSALGYKEIHTEVANQTYKAQLIGMLNYLSTLTDDERRRSVLIMNNQYLSCASYSQRIYSNSFADTTGINTLSARIYDSSKAYLYGSYVSTGGSTTLTNMSNTINSKTMILALV